MITVLLVEDHASYRQALAALLRIEDDFEVVAEVGCAGEAGEVARRTQPAVAVVDIVLPDASGVEAIRDIRAQSCRTEVVVLTGLRDDVELGRCIEAGAAAVVDKSAELAEFLATLRGVADGFSMLAAAQTSQRLEALAAARERDWRGRMVGAHLTAREHEILQQLADGAGTDDIAARLHISCCTARTHVRNLLAKLNVRSRVAAVAEAGRLGLLPSRDALDVPPRTSI